MIRRVAAVLQARTLEFLRDRSSLGWNILLPVLLVFGLAAVFSGGERPLFRLGVLGADAAAGPLQRPEVRRVAETDLERALAAVSRHQLDMLIDPAGGRYWVNPESARGRVLESLLAAENATLTRQLIAGRPIRYIDWVVPGILGMNMMFSCLFGVGYVVVRYRKSGFLRRLSATPLTALEFITAQVLSRLLLILVITVATYAGTNALLHFRMEGSYLALLVVAALGASALVSLALAICARVTSEELAGGLLNLVTWPMMVLSGVWFSMEGMNPWLRSLARVFPLTQMLDAARVVMLEGGGLADVLPEVAILAAMTGAFLVLGAVLFRWQPE